MKTPLMFGQNTQHAKLRDINSNQQLMPMEGGMQRDASGKRDNAAIAHLQHQTSVYSKNSNNNGNIFSP